MAVDSTEAQAQLEEIRGGLDAVGEGGKTGLGKVADASEKTGKSLINSHQSVHLLAEEMGIHLPRAVVGAVSEMIPAINSVGPALLGAFAVDMVIKFGEEIKKTSEKFNELAQSEKALSAIGKENQHQMEEMARASRSYALDQVSLLLLQVHGQEQVVEMMKQQEDRSVRWAGLFGEKLEEWTGHHQKLEEAEKQLTATTELYDAVLKILGEDEVKGYKDAAKAAEKAATQQEQAAKHRLAAEKQIHEWRARAIKEMAEELAAAQKQAAATAAANVATEKFLMNEITLNNALLGTKLILPPVTDATKAHVYSLQTLSKAHLELNQVMGVGKGIMKDFGEATAQSTVATIFQGVAAGESFKKVAHEAIASIAMQAGTHAAWELAQGLAMEALFYFMPNPMYQVSAGAHFAAAGVYGAIGGATAGLAAATRSGRGATGGGYAGPSSGSGGYGSPIAGSATLAPGAGGAGRFSGTARVVVFGTDHELQNWVAGAVNGAVQRGVTVTSTVSQRGAPVGH